MLVSQTMESQAYKWWKTCSGRNCTYSLIATRSSKVKKNTPYSKPITKLLVGIELSNEDTDAIA